MEDLWTETATLMAPEAAVAPMQQHASYGAACAALGTGVLWYRLDGAGGQGAAQVLIRRWPLLGATALLSRGPLWAPDTPAELRRAGLLRLLVQLRRQFRCVLVTPDPIEAADPLADSGWLATMTPCSLARLDLTPDPLALRAGLRGKWRNRLVRAEAAGLSVRDRPFSPARDDWLLAAEAAQAKARGYRRLPADFTLAWSRADGQHGTRIFTAERAGRIVAAMLFLLHGAGASYHIGWSGPAGRALGAHALLMWQAMLRLREGGVQMLDLDLIDTEAAPGLARFKLGTGAQPLVLGATRLSAPGSRIFAARPMRPKAA
ncbi:GNAT family N-acetyltransferase [Tropicimonas sp. IMCC34043]|uniref:GNAT family N-acetyltransferase n=1 Tax=Tropicimonas sp. IMCC34043 TaxID=2248760 RepID=UPI000E270EC5|nr:GNAT family N-acetyltransferase [Tropicimonas sp. IMCC34043]